MRPITTDCKGCDGFIVVKPRGPLPLRCAECDKLRANANSRAYYARNPDQGRAWNAKWYAKNRKGNPAWQKKNKRIAKAWRARNQDHIRKYVAEYRAAQ